MAARAEAAELAAVAEKQREERGRLMEEAARAAETAEADWHRREEEQKAKEKNKK